LLFSLVKKNQPKEATSFRISTYSGAKPLSLAFWSIA